MVYLYILVCLWNCPDPDPRGLKIGILRIRIRNTAFMVYIEKKNRFFHFVILLQRHTWYLVLIPFSHCKHSIDKISCFNSNVSMSHYFLGVVL
jgi:hypothetical protein